MTKDVTTMKPKPFKFDSTSTPVRGWPAVRLLALQPCLRTPGAKFPSQCCPSCEANEALGYRRSTRQMVRRLIRLSSKRKLTHSEARTLMDFSAGSFHLMGGQ